MNLSEIALKIDEIKANIDDDEKAHALEDELMVEFIKHVRDNPDDFNLEYKAKRILSTRDLTFARWCS